MGWLQDLEHLFTGSHGSGGSPHGTQGFLNQSGGGNFLSQLGGSGGSNFLAQAGGGGNFLNGGAGPPSSPQQDAFNAAQSEARYASGNPATYAQAQGVLNGAAPHRGFFGTIAHDVGGFASHALTDTVNTLDLPRDFVVSGLDQLSGHGPGFLKDLSSHRQFGQVLSDFGVKNNWVKSIGGVLGDVGLDPLTYAGGLGEMAKGLELGSKALEHAGDAKKAAEAIAGGGDLGHAVQAVHAGTLTPDTLGRLMKGGAAALQPEEQAALGLQTGLKLGVGSHTIEAPTSAFDPLSRAFNNAKFNFRGLAADSALMKRLMPHAGLRAKMFDAVKEGDFAKAYQLQNVLKAHSLIPGVKSAFLNTHGPKLAESLKGFKDGEMSDALNALEGRGPLVGDQRVAGLRSALDSVAADLKGRGVEMNTIEHYVPHQMTEAARGLAGSGKGTRTEMAAALHRTLTPDSWFLGHQLTDASAEEINQIMEEEGFNHKLFKNDLPSVLDTYLHGAGNRAGMQEFANRLADMGLTKSAEISAPMQEWLDRVKVAKSTLNKATHANERQAGAVADERARLTQQLSDHEATWNGATMTGAQKGVYQSKRAAIVRKMAALEKATPTDTKPLEDELARVQSLAKPQGENVGLGNAGAFKGQEAQPFVKDAIQKLAQEQSDHLAANGGRTAAGKYMDKWLGLWRNYALAMPGKAIRHTMAAPAWGHFLGDVELRGMPESMGIWKKYVKGGMDAVPEEERATVQQFLNQGLQHGHGFHTSGVATEDLDSEKRLTKAKGALKSKAAYNPLSSDFAYFKGNRELQARGQDFSRFAMFRDAIKNKGLRDVSAGEKVRSLLGDPGNLTDWERMTMRRAVPFYAFLRTQMPAQIKGLIDTPGKFVNFINAGKDIGGGSTPPMLNGQSLVPGYFGAENAIQTPIGGTKNPLFVTPDLPFTRMNNVLGQPLSEINPLAQLFLENYTNTNPMTGAQFSKNAKPLPGVLQDIPGVAPLLDAIGKAMPLQQDVTDSYSGKTTTAGTQMLTDRSLNEFENLFPLASTLVDLSPKGGATKPGGGTAGLITNLVGAVRGQQDPAAQQANVEWAKYFAINQLVQDAINKGALQKPRGFHAA